MESKFLHNHPQKEKTLGLDENHVIVDREDWEQAKQIIKTNKRIGIIGGGFQGFICGIDEAKSIVGYHIARENLIVAPGIPNHDVWYEKEEIEFKDQLKKLGREEFAREYLFDFENERVVNKQELLNSFERMNEQMILSAENLDALSENIKAYDRENNPKKKHKGHERPYKFHR